MPNHVKKLLLRQSTLEARKYLRAKILLSKDRGLSNEKIADRLDITVPTVRLCIEKYENGGVENALEDIKGRGRKKEISDSDEMWVINKVCQKPVDLGLSAEMWCPASFTRYLNSVAVKEGHPRLEHVSEYTVRKILAKAKIQPFKVKYYCEKRDPNFDSKMHDVLVIYKQLELQFNDDGTVNASDDEGVVHTLSYDEKPGIQAIESTTADLPPRSGTAPTSTAGSSTAATRNTMVINAKRPMGNMPVAYYRGGNQSSLCHGIQQTGDGAGWCKRRITLLRQH